MEKELGKHQTYHQKRLFMQLKLIQIFYITPFSLTWSLKKPTIPKRKVVFQTTFLRSYIELEGCMHDWNWIDCSNLKETVQIPGPFLLFFCPHCQLQQGILAWSYWPFFSKYFTWWVKKQCSYATTVRSILFPVLNNTMYYHTALLKVRKQRILHCKRNH